MKLPDFSEFVASIDVEEFGAEFNAVDMPRLVQFDPNDREAIEKTVTLLYQHTLTMASRISVVHLRKYHEWLQSQLQ